MGSFEALDVAFQSDSDPDMEEDPFSIELTAENPTWAFIEQDEDTEYTSLLFLGKASIPSDAKGEYNIVDAVSRYISGEVSQPLAILRRSDNLFVDLHEHLEAPITIRLRTGGPVRLSGLIMKVPRLNDTDEEEDMRSNESS